MERLKEEVLQYLAIYPSVGIIRLASDLGVPLPEVEAAVRELAREGIVEYVEEMGVVNYLPWVHGFIKAGYKLAGGEEEEREPVKPKRQPMMTDFFEGWSP